MSRVNTYNQRLLERESIVVTPTGIERTSIDPRKSVYVIAVGATTSTRIRKNPGKEEREEFRTFEKGLYE